MGLSINYLYEFSLRLIRKNQSGSISGSDFSKFWNDAQFGYIGDLLGRYQPRANTKNGINTGLILNETILTKLMPFTVSDTLTISAGNADKPTDFLYRLACRISDYDVFFINKGQISSVKKSVIDPPSITDNKYYATEYEDYYSFLPTTVTQATLDYVAQPNSVIWGFTYDADGRQVYNEGTSVQSQWDDLSNMEITKRMLVDYGVSLKDNDFQNFGNKIETVGV